MNNRSSNADGKNSNKSLRQLLHKLSKLIVIQKCGLVTLSLVTISACHRLPVVHRGENPPVLGMYLTNVGTAAMHHTTLLDEALHSMAKDGVTDLYVSAYGLGGTLFSSKAAYNTS